QHSTWSCVHNRRRTSGLESGQALTAGDGCDDRDSAFVPIRSHTSRRALKCFEHEKLVLLQSKFHQ
ncbi:hypothetical protein L916_03528, partial [Phytophthora nicotianae]